jgi:hypothetical protein
MSAWMVAAVPAMGQTPAPRQPPGTLVPATAPAPRIHPAVARIVAPGNGSISYGSGTLIYASEQQAVVVTNWHVVHEATGPISVHFPDGFYSLGKVQAIDRDWDLAAIAIRKPNAHPVRIAGAAPRPGEILTIAGYGSGNYRAASGVCTQYVAPGTTFPFEMVEVAVSARQGDSGGPMFNSRGELAGVLFGEGEGRTSGSYCGRVRWFLSSVVPSDLGPAPGRNPTMVAVNPPPARPLRTAPDDRGDRMVVTQAAAKPPLARIDAPAAGAPVALTGAVAPASKANVAASPHVTVLLPVATQTIGWTDVAGETLGAQIKTVLAAVGVLAILLHTLHWVSCEKAA